MNNKQRVLEQAKEDYMVCKVFNWAADCIREQKAGNIVLSQIKIALDRFGRRPFPLTDSARKNDPKYAALRDKEDAMPIHFDISTGWNKGGTGGLVSCETEYEGAQKVVDAFKWCLRSMNPTPQIDELQLTTREGKQLSFDF